MLKPQKKNKIEGKQKKRYDLAPLVLQYSPTNIAFGPQRDRDKERKRVWSQGKQREAERDPNRAGVSQMASFFDLLR